MATFKNLKISHIGGHGFSSNMDCDVDTAEISHTGGDGVHLEKPITLIEYLGLPENSNPQALAQLLELLLSSAKTTNDEKREVIKESNFWKLLGHSADFIAVSDKIINILTLPNIPLIITALIAMNK